MMNDLVLEWKSGDGYERNVQIILPNIQGQRYVFGSKYPGEREGEEFFIYRNEGIRVDSTHFVIRVDRLGQYWVQSETTKFKTFVSSERLLMEPRLLGIGDTVFLEDAEIRYGYPRRRHPIVHVKERIVPGSDQEIEPAGSDSDSDSEACKAMKELDLDDVAESPLDNSLVLENIMSYLPVRDLRNARLVCKNWMVEASKPLEKKGGISFTFNHDYLNPENSTMVFLYLHEMRDMKIQNLHITLSLCSVCCQDYQDTLFFSAGEPGQKMMDDLRKLLNSSHNFSTLYLKADITEESGFLPFSLILQELGEKLVELKLEIFYIFFPAVLPSFSVMKSLKKLTDTGSLSSDDMKQRWVSHFVPLLSNNLEHLTCDGDTAETYIKEFLNHPMPKLRGLALKKETCAWTISTLLELETPLTFLEIQYCEECTEPEYEELFERLLLKHSTSLKHLVIRIGNGNDNDYHYHNDKDKEVNFPPFPKLVELEVEYDQRTRIGWGHETSLDYEDHFPSLRKLTVRPRQPWREDDHVFNVFFRRQELRCETVNELWVPVLRNPERPSNWPSVPDIEFQPRMDQIRKMFPSAVKMNFLQ